MRSNAARWLTYLAVLCVMAAAILLGVALHQPVPPAHQIGFAAVHEEPRSPKWPAVRAAHLKIEPACAFCGHTKDLQVHHVLEFRVRPDLELDPDNLITLCGPGIGSHNCHLLHGHLGNYRLWNPNVRDDAKRYREEVEEAKRKESQ